MEPLAHIRHTGVNATMDKANILLRDIMGGPLQFKPIGTHVGLGAEEHAAGLHIQAVHQPKRFARVQASAAPLPDRAVWRKVFPHPGQHLQFFASLL